MKTLSGFFYFYPMKTLYLIAIMTISFSSFAQEINIGMRQSAEPEPQSIPDENTVYNTAGLTVQADYPGGISALLAYIDSKIQKKELDANVSAKVYVSFIIEADGSLTDIKTVRDSGYGLGKSVENALKQSTVKWLPGKINGKPVRTRFNLPVTIKNDIAQETKFGDELIAVRNGYTGDLEKSPDAGEGNTIYNIAGIQIPPNYPDGNIAFKDFILSKIKITEVPKDVKMLKAYVSFVVEKDGMLTDIKTLRDPGFGIGKELERAISQSPKWNPGVQNGKPVRTRYNLPIAINFK